MIKLIGYWRPTVSNPYWINPDEPDWAYPDPNDLVDWGAFWVQHDKPRVIQYLKDGARCNDQMGSSGCRICDKELGSFERSDGVWCWPDQLEHYIEEHNVILPQEFVDYSETAVSPKLEFPPLKLVKVDSSFWEAWSKPYRKPAPIPMTPEEYLRTKSRHPLVTMGNLRYKKS